MSRVDNIGPDVELIRDSIKVELEWIGEGWDGDYQEDDPEDDPLLRFTFYRKDAMAIAGWDQIDDTSYCTQLIADKVSPM